MSTFHGLPAHILLNHFIVVLAPLAAILATVCALWPAARRRLVWLVLALAVVTVVLTPLTASAGVWLLHRVPRSPTLDSHAGLGDSMLYFSAALLAAAALLAVLHLREARGRPVKSIVHVVITVLVIIASVATTVQVYRIGDSGARAAWGDLASSTQ